MSVVINFNFGSGKSPALPEVRQRSLDIQPEHYSPGPEMVRYLVYEGLTPLDILQHRAVGSGKAKGKQCKKGQACGNSCISATKTCQKGLNGAQKEKAKTVKAKTAAKGNSKSGGEQGKDPGAESSQSGTDQPPTLKTTNYNPYAVADLTPGEFSTYLDNKNRISRQDAPDAIHNKSFEQAKSDGSVRNKNDYLSKINESIERGLIPSDEALSGVKLTKSLQAKVEENRQKMNDMRQESKRLDDAINHPLMTDDDKKGYSPFLGKEEANAYTKDTFLGNISIWHGNRLDITDSIAGEGMMPERNSRGMFGKGGYFAVKKEVAESYVDKADIEERYPQKGLIESKAKIKNPYIATEKELEKISEYFPGDQQNLVDSTKLTNYLRAKGHDSIYLKDYGYVITFAQEQSVSVGYEKIDRGSKREKDIAEYWAYGGSGGNTGSTDDMKRISSQDKNYQALDKAQKTEDASKIEKYVEPDDYF